jgi:hypothetical protein
MRSRTPALLGRGFVGDDSLAGAEPVAWSHDGGQLAIVCATDTSDIVLLRELR